MARRWLFGAAGLAAVLAGVRVPAETDPRVAVEAPPAIHLTDPRLYALLERGLPGATPERLAAVARDFEVQLHRSSPNLAMRFATGRMDDEELEPRVAAFLRKLEGTRAGVAAAAPAEPRARVLAALGRQALAPAAETERDELADRFLTALAARSRIVHADLLAGRLSDENLDSRLAVFLEDQRAAAIPEVPAATSAAAEAERFALRNFGRPAERVDAIALRCTVELPDGRRDLVVYRKRPDFFRLHFCENGIVTLATGFDGSRAWMQRPARPGVEVPAAEAAPLQRSARFDHALVGWEERGAVLTVVSRDDAKNLIRLSVREKEGTEIISTIDTKTYEETASEEHRPDGTVEETRFRDYRRFGILNVPQVQESWKGGTLRTTTRVTDVVLNPGLLDSVFARPRGGALDFMDYMGALGVVARAAPAAAAAPSAGTGDRR